MKLGKTKNEERSRAVKYRSVGRALLETARALDLIGDDRYGNGLAIIAVHTAIAYTDALTIAHSAKRSTDSDHMRAADVLAFALGAQSDAVQLKRLRRILDLKAEASYGGTFYTLEEGRDLLWHAEKYAVWAEEMLGTT